ncbi:GTP cyclohydrolase II-domain-containing protein [Suillus subluteus]|nr:GTP cyclohydrolase II-domain-containing protein [Suillus subluteus]
MTRLNTCNDDIGRESATESDTALLDVLTSPRWQGVQKFSRRDAALDPLLLAVAASAGARTTRNHYHHDFFPGAQADAVARSKRAAEDTNKPQERKRMSYVSKQGPRRLRLQPTISPQPAIASQAISLAGSSPISSIEVKCMARTRIPTPHGPAFLHLYHNNRDNKEHLAIVVDPAQYSDDTSVLAPPIRSRSLDAVWSDDETDMDRIIRGAYVGKLSATSQHPSRPSLHQPSPTTSIPSPLVRIHSECFTGETVGSMRCDCGEQLDEAIHLISQPISLPDNVSPNSRSMPGRGAVIYLKQEGRGIGLLSKIRAYNLQDLGHDTVTANLMLGHQADERGYEIAIAILRDLGLGSELGEGVRLLTNNPDKVQALEKEGLRVAERVPMVPRSWRHRSHSQADAGEAQLGKAAGVTMIGGEAVRGEDLDKYLRTKILRMGHMLPLYLAGEQAAS